MTFFLGMLFGAVGSGYLIYARRQYDGLLAVAGVLLMIFPWFVDSALATIVVGVILCAAPFAIRRWL